MHPKFSDNLVDHNVLPGEEFKLIVAGGRDYNDADMVERVLIGLADVELADQAISIVSGMAQGADLLAYNFAKRHDIKCYPFPADWDNLDAPGAVVRYTRQGKPYNMNAGFTRNHAMGRFSHGLLAFWNGKSRGTKDMIDFMLGLKKPVHVHIY